MSDKLTRKEAIDYQCWECMGFYADGKTDCENVRCPLYAYMPYRQLEPVFPYKNLSPKHKGKVDRESVSKPASPQAIEALRKYRESKEAEGSADGPSEEI